MSTCVPDVLHCLNKYGFAVVSCLGEELLNGLQAEAAAALEQAEAHICRQQGTSVASAHEVASRL